ncbi:MAG: Penicillin-binding protein 2 [Candidatus Kaiserbacteria bacterium GW2011_GWA2_52_12]|uniref:Penicillin-binding protein 2 n=1 Tax=Candidatus Kaiserbacteria bacterium GW2011_GWA2_52_12 TaxID=1618671 RepID=A0A0G1WVZ6_9BACT|nr:MAG: Penicillin-binding protein 2 [Candidatus Kaiserbacteria bacterium GW2011_GWA2_52_12]
MSKKSRFGKKEINPDEIFLDSSNLPELNEMQFEGRVTLPVSRRALFSVGTIFILFLLVFCFRAVQLQIVKGASYADISRNNTLDTSIIFATRGVIFDRTGKELAWNDIQTDASTSAAATTSSFALRRYIPLPGLSHLIGFVQYPKADRSGYWWREDSTGMSGVELAFDPQLHGKNGSSMIESDARGNIERENIVALAEPGSDLKLSIDADVQSKLYRLLSVHAQEQGFQGGAAVIMDVETGEVLALTSFPEYDHAAFTNGTVAAVRAASVDKRTPLLNRAISGLYAPGSIVKPIFAAAHGLVDMRTAIAVSSDEYFYTIGGGYGGQVGLGINRLDQYARAFGLGKATGIAFVGEEDGLIPTPQWKEATFNGDPWRIGNTYHTAIGQYGFQITPIQAVTFIAAIANGGKLLVPQLLASSTPQYRDIGISDENLAVVREGMRLAVTSTRQDATVKALNIPVMHIAAKTGTAQVGAHNQWMNSWSVGFWPAEHPRYAYAVVLERAPAGTASGAAPGMQPFFYWLAANHPEYANPGE